MSTILQRTVRFHHTKHTLSFFITPHVVAEPCVCALCATKLQRVSVMRCFNVEFNEDVGVLKGHLALIARLTVHSHRLADVAWLPSALAPAVAWS